MRVKDRLGKSGSGERSVREGVVGVEEYRRSFVGVGEKDEGGRGSVGGGGGESYNGDFA